MEIMDPTRDLQEDGEDDEEEFMRKDGSSQKGGSRGDGKNSGDGKANMPRSKHSETEQRRRSKINERFQILRDLLPPSDQKRDKASFLLEVIEYVQFLHEKLHKYESQHGNQEPSKLAPWRYSYWTSEGMVENSRLVKNGSGPGLMFAGKVNENNVSIMPTMPANAQNLIEADHGLGVAFKTVELQQGDANKEVPLPTPMQPNPFTPVGSNDGMVQPIQRPISDEENITSQPPTIWQNQPWTTDCPTSETSNEPEVLTMEGGTISIASVYSQGLLNNLTQALQSSGVDLSHASISVQVDLGKRAIGRSTTATSSAKDHANPSTTKQARTHSRGGSSGEDTDETQKRQKAQGN
ncbi:hypothetical protein AQUCO_00600387v1 [Aquilegia coerulea]|uniref:BHLH domain-containing protein n=1 Tax=Aquilegia coerulea TaxID=218851 RepID=A0A2G5EPU1_AQUCA|nr:hypothetical protein AQUCO_00600387v1 [Aquilegia coerulea]